MSTADHILDQIDNALTDYAVSDDAMRSRPEPELISFGGFTPTVQIMDEVGAWQDLGVTSVEICITTPPALEEFAQQWAGFIDGMTRQRLEHARRAQEVLEVFTQALTEAMKPAAEAAAQAMTAFQEAVQACPATPPGRRRDRPAWQSPYGPARRRR